MLRTTIASLFSGNKGDAAVEKTIKIGSVQYNWTGKKISARQNVIDPVYELHVKQMVITGKIFYYLKEYFMYRYIWLFHQCCSISLWINFSSWIYIWCTTRWISTVGFYSNTGFYLLYCAQYFTMFVSIPKITCYCTVIDTNYQLKNSHYGM